MILLKLIITLVLLIENLVKSIMQLKILKKLLEINPSYTLAHLNLGITLADLGQKDEAVKCFEQVISIEPDNSLAHEKLKELSTEIRVSI